MLLRHDRDIEDPWLRSRLAALPAGARVLDVGCVDGWVLDEYPEALGVDSRSAPGAWGSRVWVGDAAVMPFETGSFDAVSCVSVLEHVGLGWYGDPPAAGPAAQRDKVQRVLAEMLRVLAPGGWLFLTVPLGLTMTKDGRPFARPVWAAEVALWVEQSGGLVLERLEVDAYTWDAAPDDAGLGTVRRLLLLSAQRR
jgi:SAM-dependent methyltransferase